MQYYYVMGHSVNINKKKDMAFHLYPPLKLEMRADGKRM